MLTKQHIPLQQALKCLIQTTQNKQQKYYYLSLSQQLEQGLHLSQSLCQLCKNLTPYEQQLIILGEKTQQLPQCLDQLSYLCQHHQQLKEKIIAACFYPCLTLCFAIMMAITLLFTVLPQCLALYQQNHHALPALTQTLLTITLFLKHWGMLILLITTSTLLLTSHQIVHNPRWRKQWQIWSTSLPFIHAIQRDYRYSKLCHMLSLALNQHMPFLDALTLVINSQNHLVTQQSFQKIKQYLSAGHPLTSAMTLAPSLPPIFVELMRTGAESGTLSQSLEQLSAYFTQSLEQHCAILQRWLNPLLLVLVACLIGTIMMALYLPLFDIGEMI